MALKALMLRKRLDAAKKELQTHLDKRAEFEAKEKELETALEELTEDSTEEERSACEEAIEGFEKENAENEEKIRSLEETVGEIEEELAAEEAEQETEPEAEAEPEADPEPAENRTRKEVNTMTKRTKYGMTYEQRDAFTRHEDVQAFLARVRECIVEKRALSNVGLTVPTSILGLLRENIAEYSKLYKHVNVQQVSGEGRQVIMGTIPEAVWTEMCANLNELDLSFYGVEVDGYKVGGYFAVCNAMAEDNDVDLLDQLVEALGQAIGLALDKAILYGTGTKMPLGVVTRLAQEEAPADYPADARPWDDLSTTNVIDLGIESTSTPQEIIQKITLFSGMAKGAYSRGAKVWVMNETTYNNLLAALVAVDGSGAFVSSVNGTMPVAGGAIEVLDFVPNGNIICGYFDLYLLAERAGTNITQSEHVRFIQDQIVLKGTARYDGKPSIAEGFVVMGMDRAPATTVTFAPDTANQSGVESGVESGGGGQ